MRLVVLSAVLVASTSHAQVPATFAYQGRLVDPRGVGVAGPVAIVFSLYDAEDGGTVLWREAQDLALTDGYYATSLGAKTPLPAAAFQEAPRYLSLEVAQQELTPRTPLQSVPYALVAAALVGKLGEAESLPAPSCAALLASRPGLASGPYWLKPPTAKAAFRAYCDMVNESGGWTLVWSNLRGGRGKPMTELTWSAAIRTLPLVRGTVSADLESFQVYTGLVHWTALAPAKKLRYDWNPDYGANIDQRAVMTFGLDAAKNYQLALSDYVQTVGNAQAGLWTVHKGAPYTTYDADHDAWGRDNCSASYGNAPWWYVNCWDGSLAGGGEFDTARNGAFWMGSASAWGQSGGIGAGNGWLYVK